MPDIGCLSLNLPVGFEHRAHRLAALTAQALSRMPWAAQASLPLLSLPPVKLDPRRSDHALADVLARHIAGGVQRAMADLPAGEPPC